MNKRILNLSEILISECESVNGDCLECDSAVVCDCLLGQYKKPCQHDAEELHDIIILDKEEKKE